MLREPLGALFIIGGAVVFFVALFQTRKEPVFWLFVGTGLFMVMTGAEIMGMFA